jgi:hypothetical protein
VTENPQAAQVEANRVNSAAIRTIREVVTVALKVKEIRFKEEKELQPEIPEHHQIVRKDRSITVRINQDSATATKAQDRVAAVQKDLHLVKAHSVRLKEQAKEGRPTEAEAAKTNRRSEPKDRHVVLKTADQHVMLEAENLRIVHTEAEAAKTSRRSEPKDQHVVLKTADQRVMPEAENLRIVHTEAEAAKTSRRSEPKDLHAVMKENLKTVLSKAEGLTINQS